MACKTSNAEFLDASGLRCPLPLLRTKQALNRMATGQVLQVISTDKGSWRDIPAYIAQSPHQLLEHSELASGQFRYLILKGEG